MQTSPSTSSAFLSSGIASYRRSNSARVRRSPFSSGGITPLSWVMFDSAGLAGWVETAMELASRDAGFFEGSTRSILRDFAPARQRRPDQGRDARESLNARDSCSDPAAARL